MTQMHIQLVQLQRNCIEHKTRFFFFFSYIHFFIGFFVASNFEIGPNDWYAIRYTYEFYMKNSVNIIIDVAMAKTKKHQQQQIKYLIEN